MKNKKIAFIVSTLNTGGAQRILSNIVVNAPTDWDIDIILNDTHNIVYPYRGNIVDLGIKPTENKRSLIYQGKVFVVRFWKLMRLKKNGHYTCMVSILESANIVNALTGNKYCATVAYVHCNLSRAAVNKKDKYIVNPIDKRCLKHMDYVVGVSHEVCKDLIEHYGSQRDRTVSIINGYDVKRLKKQCEEKIDMPYRWKESTNRLIAIGRLNTQKAFWHLIRSFREVKKKVPDSILLILGEGEDERYLINLCKKMGLGKDVIFAGFKNNPFPYIKEAKALVASSIFEGFPNSIAEALCLGIPCVSTDIESGPRELLAPDTPFDEHIHDHIEIAQYGILTPKCDGIRHDEKIPITREEYLLAEGICKLLLDHALYDSIKRKIPERISTLDVSNMVEQWSQLIDKIGRDREG